MKCVLAKKLLLEGSVNQQGSNAGWKHFYLDFGNHLVCKEEYYEKLENIFKGFRNSAIAYGWTEILKEAGFVQNLNN